MNLTISRPVLHLGSFWHTAEFQRILMPRTQPLLKQTAHSHTLKHALYSDSASLLSCAVFANIFHKTFLVHCSGYEYLFTSFDLLLFADLSLQFSLHEFN